ncbi:isocitrate lyase/PEP mutase family protein [Blastochloris sulfoviridis]|uniref:Isocitrate lyase/phosphoenolpyruvate mutase family protein n=1 Tax=Blastochloris sulfoviridis TaxID=50712 RepID=A0A5M6I294_9HYPH|nr:isocitrate lyase/phosphoenolpyruvate mutase family protein [Blastochloris sulfoviridis]KAA5602292.1 isocitrate lyase/phosphoenolpyruvate mutase family protein [Blastochloris sulfoviridis]
MSEQAEKAARFRALHAAPGAFVIPNPWDAGTAKLLTSYGFPALATTSAGFAYSLGRPDGMGLLRREELLINAADIAGATALPVSGDLENGFGERDLDIETTIIGASAAGLVGGSIEDATGNSEAPIYAFDAAVARIRTAAAAARSLPHDFVLVARAENFLHGRPDFDDTLKRLVAYAEAGADCLYAPGVSDPELIKAIVRAVAPKPVNVLVPGKAGLSAADLAALGVKRISLGSALVRVCIGALMRAAEEIMIHGTFTALNGAVAYGDVQARFRDLLERERADAAGQS